jgi:hypothetical protein
MHGASYPTSKTMRVRVALAPPPAGDQIPDDAARTWTAAPIMVGPTLIPDDDSQPMALFKERIVRIDEATARLRC